MRKRRWQDISMVFQGAMNSWNPVYRIGDQIKEALDLHWPTKLNRAETRQRIGDLFALVGLPSDAQDRYPHEFSGGMRQRATIAMALSCNPQVIIADEPTTALDVIVQDQILKELKKIQADLDMSIIYISHDIAVIAEVTDRMGVMYAGKMVEFGATSDIFSAPRHPYAWLLLSSTPRSSAPGASWRRSRANRPTCLILRADAASTRAVPSPPINAGNEEPPLQDIGDGHQVACWNYEEVPVGITSGGVV